jgi:hypothetical protein
MGTRLRLLGQDVLVYSNGIVWDNPDTNQRFMIGKTRAEAEAALLKWKELRYEGYLSCNPTPLLPRLPTKDNKPERVYWFAYYNAASRARRSGVPLMSKAEYGELVARAAGRCEVSGIQFSADKPPGHTKRMWAPSIDRINCKGTYSADNCRLVCIAVNIALNEFGLEVLSKIALALGSMPLTNMTDDQWFRQVVVRPKSEEWKPPLEREC